MASNSSPVKKFCLTIFALDLQIMGVAGSPIYTLRLSRVPEHFYCLPLSSTDILTVFQQFWAAERIEKASNSNTHLKIGLQNITMKINTKGNASLTEVVSSISLRWLSARVFFSPISKLCPILKFTCSWYQCCCWSAPSDAVLSPNLVTVCT